MAEELEAQYTEELERLREELTGEIPPESDGDTAAVDEFLASDALDDNLVKYVVLRDATPKGLADFADQGETEAGWIEQLLSDVPLMKRMLVADGPRGDDPAQYGPAMKIYNSILEASPEAVGDEENFLNRFALGIALEHAVPHAQSNPKDMSDSGEAFVDPLQRYLHYKQAYDDDELDPYFHCLTTWDYRMVVDGGEPDETLAWGRQMLRNYRPDHAVNFKYSSVVSTDVRYGGGYARRDRDDLQFYQNIIMNGGVCGRRAFFGRFICRAFGIPTKRRPSPGHAALTHWTPNHGWVIELGGGWGLGGVGPPYKRDLSFKDSTVARTQPEAYLKVKRAQWVGDVMGEPRFYGTHEENLSNIQFWYTASFRTQVAIIEELGGETCPALCGEPKQDTIMNRILAAPATPEEDNTIVYSEDDGIITIPAAKAKSFKDVSVMKCFLGGSQAYLPGFTATGHTVLRGGTFKNPDHACCSGKRLLSGGKHKYPNWGFRAAVSMAEENEEDGVCNTETLTLDMCDDDGNCVTTMEFIYIHPGTFIMGGESEIDDRFRCVEVPHHEVEITQGYYLGKYPVTQQQYEVMMGENPSAGNMKYSNQCPVGNLAVLDCKDFCLKMSDKTGHDVRMPTEAEWEYACRAGQGESKWFFGDDPSELGEYAWYKPNGEGKVHPVGEKKPNPWGLYDIYGNVQERISDTYERNYYATSPREDPTGPQAGTKSHFEFKIQIPAAGTYSLTARIVTVGYYQTLNVAVGGDGGHPKEEEEDDENNNDNEEEEEEKHSHEKISLPYTGGSWQSSDPVELQFEEGENELKFWRDKPPQNGIVIKDFTLTPL